MDVPHAAHYLTPTIPAVLKEDAMPRRASLTTLLVVAILCHAPATSAQEAPRIWIQSVSVDASAGTLTITGSGFSETCEVTLDGQAVTVVTDRSATKLVV